MTIGENVKRFRVLAKLTQDELKNRAGIDGPGTISLIELDKREPELKTLRQLAAALGVSIFDLLAEGEAEASAEPPYEAWPRFLETIEAQQAMKTSPGTIAKLRSWRGFDGIPTVTTYLQLLSAHMSVIREAVTGSPPKVARHVQAPDTTLEPLTRKPKRTASGKGRPAGAAAAKVEQDPPSRVRPRER